MLDVGSEGGDIGENKRLGGNESYALQRSHFWEPSDYLNVFIGPEESGVGYASSPWVLGSNPLLGLLTDDDAAFCKNTSDIFECAPKLFLDTDNALLSTGLIHEVGHVLGLLHPMSNNNCITSDFSPDTFSYVFRFPGQPCTDNQGVTVSDNFMDYLGTKNTFTYDQRERIRHVLEYGLWIKDLKNSLK